MNRLTATVQTLRARGEGAFMPFLVIGDPDLETAHRLVDALIEAGADVLEFGFPFSDPPADGPVIQAADHRALAAGVTPEKAFAFLAAVQARHDVPVALLIYYNLVLQYGVEAFYARYLASVPAPLARELRPWLAPLRRLTWLRTTTWCAKWRIEAAKAPATIGSTDERSTWSAERQDPRVIAGVRARIDDYFDPDSIARIRAEWIGPDRLSFDHE